MGVVGVLTPEPFWTLFTFVSNIEQYLIELKYVIYMFPFACHWVQFYLILNLFRLKIDPARTTAKKGVVNQIINRKSLDAFKGNLTGVKSSLSALGMHVTEEN